MPGKELKENTSITAGLFPPGILYLWISMSTICVRHPFHHWDSSRAALEWMWCLPPNAPVSEHRVKSSDFSYFHDALTAVPSRDKSILSSALPYMDRYVMRDGEAFMFCHSALFPKPNTLSSSWWILRLGFAQIDTLVLYDWRWMARNLPMSSTSTIEMLASQVTSKELVKDIGGKFRLFWEVRGAVWYSFNVYLL